MRFHITRSTSETHLPSKFGCACVMKYNPRLLWAVTFRRFLLYQDKN